jgi:hypothetical protein
VAAAPASSLRAAFCTAAFSSAHLDLADALRGRQLGGEVLRRGRLLGQAPGLECASRGR